MGRVETKATVLVIEGDKKERETLVQILSPSYVTSGVATAPEGIAILEKSRVDLVIISDSFGNDSLVVCESLKADVKTKNIPVIILTGANDEDRLAAAFFAGADDVVPKPVRPKGFLARIQAKLKKLDEQKKSDEILTCGNLVLDSGKHSASVGGKHMLLTGLEFKLLKYLILNKERVMSRDMILEAMWEKDVTPRVIDNHIMSLRRKIKSADYILVSVYGAGYVFKKID